mmetsp:Transcript_55806/g.167256  ORF Transcript_55806/g.167256 Transcript_55806/m.167256 type:complete len:86 (+) Transcript_55806:929-1186(+)
MLRWKKMCADAAGRDGVLCPPSDGSCSSHEDLHPPVVGWRSQADQAKIDLTAGRGEPSSPGIPQRISLTRTIADVASSVASSSSP